MLKRICLLGAFFVAAAAVSSLHAEEKIIAKLGPDTPMKVQRGPAAWEGDTLKCKMPFTIVFPTRFKVDPSKIYALSGEFRATSGNPTKDNMWFGFLCYNEKGREISSLSLNRTVPILAELAEPAAKGSVELVFKSIPAAWEKHLQINRFFAVGAKEDRSDLPNLNLLAYTGKSMEKRADGTASVKLRRPLAAEIAAGTKIAIHSHGDTYVFVARKKAGTEWTAIGGSCASKAEVGVLAFRPTTASVAIGIFCRDKEGEIEIRNLKLVESED